MNRIATALTLSVLTATGPLAAASDSPSPAAPAAPSPLQQAIEHHNKGLEHQQLAWDHEKRAAASHKDREKHLKRAQQEYQKAIAEQLAATRKNPEFHEAFSSLGYAYRKTGDYARALTAYDQALALEPGYAQAVEYRGEAYLGLNRVGEAQQAYEWLFLREPKHAEALLLATKQWVDERGRDPSGVAAEVIEGVGTWVARKEAAAEELSGLKEPKTDW